MKRLAPFALIAAAAAALSACSTVAAVTDAVTPDRKQDAAPQEGRRTVLPTDQGVAVDPALAGRAPSLPEAVNVNDWPTPGGSADNAPGNRAGDGELNVAWRRNLVDGSNRTSRLAAPPIVAEQKLFVFGADQTVRAFELGEDAREIWRVSMRPSDSEDRRAIGGGVTYADGVVYAVSGYGMAGAFRAANGEEVWRAAGVAPFSGAPVAGGGRIYAVTNDSELFAIDATSGDVAWTHQAIAETARILAAPNPALAGETVIAPFASGEVVALLAPNGRRLWVDALSRVGQTTSLSSINDIAGSPVIADGVIYAVSHSGVLAAIDQRTGQRIWSKPFASTQTPLVVGDAVFVMGVDGELAAFDRATGGVFWIIQMPRFRDEEDRQGRIVWTGPIMVSGKLILASSQGEVAEVSAEDGKWLRAVEVGDPIFIPPIAAGGYVYLLSDTGRLIALK